MRPRLISVTIPPAQVRRLHQLQRIISAIAIVAGLLALLGWAADIPVLVRLSPDLPPLLPLSALGLILAGAGLSARGAAGRAIGATLLLSALAVGLARALALAGVLDFDPHGGMPTSSVVLNMLLGGIALLLRDAPGPRGARNAQLLGLLVVLNAVRGLVGFVAVDMTPLLIPSQTGMSLHGSVCVLLLGLGLLVDRPDSGFMALVVSRRPAGRLLRWLFMAGFALPMLLVIVAESAWRSGLFGTGVGLVMLVLGNIWIFYRAAAAYDRADQRRHAAEDRLALANLDLERRVADRTAALERDRRYQAALFACSQALLRAAAPAAGEADAQRLREAALDEALGQLLAGAGADRVFLMQLVDPPDGAAFVELEAELCAPGIAPALMRPEPLRIPVSLLTPLIGLAAAPGEPIAGTIDELAARAPAFAAMAAGWGVQSLIVLPLHLERRRWRAIGFHDCTGPRRWDEQETLLLRTAAELIGGALTGWAGEDELRRREELLATIFDILPVGLAVIDARGTPQRTNRAIQQIAGLSADEARTGDYMHLPYFHPDGRPVSAPEFPIVRAMAGEVVRDLEVSLRRRDGGERWVSVSAAPLPVMDMGGILVAVDITERRRVEAERLSFERKLLEAQRLESLGVLAGGVAHDFNNILAAILGHAELARLDVDPAGEAAASLDAIVLGAQRAADLTGQMLAYAGRGGHASEAVDLNQVARELGQLTRATLPRGVSVRHFLAAGLPAVSADGTQVRQVLLNLLTNAGEAMVAAGGGGAISVSSGRCELDAEELAGATVGAAAPGAYGYLEVADMGVGIEPEVLARIFDPFFSTKFTGRGLGLAAVQGIVRAHGGALFVHSAPGEGSCFRACFPLNRDKVTG